MKRMHSFINLLQANGSDYKLREDYENNAMGTIKVNAGSYLYRILTCEIAARCRVLKCICSGNYGQILTTRTTPQRTFIKIKCENYNLLQ